jgi:hypothetical protein
MQINKDIFLKKEDKIVIDYNPKTGKYKWLKDFVNKVININPKKDLGKAK